MVAAQIWLASALCALATAAPTLNTKAVEVSLLSDYFALLASKIQAAKSMATAPVCDLTLAAMPIASPTPLPTPSAGLYLKHVAIGRGIQNYTCGTNASAAPAAIGAVATLFNASCLASTYPDVLASTPAVVLDFNLSTTTNTQILAPSNLLVSGHHFFTNNTTPFFDLSSAAQDLGHGPSAKNNSVAAPATASVGQGGVGHGAVAWLKLKFEDAATGGLTEVYRLNTAGGSPPTTCAGILSSTIEVQYAAEYWFYAKP